MPIGIFFEGFSLFLKTLERKRQKPPEQWTREEAEQWLRDYRAEVEATRTDAILGPPDQAKEQRWL